MILKDAPILLLDEATAALDSESEEAIREALGRLMRGRTVIAIAHRLATLRNFDRVIMLQGGRIIEDGSPDRLMQDHGPYRELVTQLYFQGDPHQQADDFIRPSPIIPLTQQQGPNNTTYKRGTFNVVLARQ